MSYGINHQVGVKASAVTRCLRGSGRGRRHGQCIGGRQHGPARGL